jgi:hypothetical protein
MEHRKYMIRLTHSIGKSADGIIEEVWWNTVVKELNEISKDCADELQSEIDLPFAKPPRPDDGVGAYCLQYKKAPPTRLLALEISLTAWIGWIFQDKNPELVDEFWKKIEEAHRSGVELRKSGDKLIDA